MLFILAICLILFVLAALGALWIARTGEPKETTEETIARILRKP